MQLLAQLGRQSLPCGAQIPFLKVDAAGRAGRILNRLLGTEGGGHGMSAGGTVLMPEKAQGRDWRREEAALTLGVQRAIGGNASAPFRRLFPPA